MMINTMTTAVITMRNLVITLEAFSKARYAVGSTAAVGELDAAGAPAGSGDGAIEVRFAFETGADVWGFS
jgi:hypothetical protein